MPEEHEKLRCSETRVSCGGSAANTAHWLARLGVDTRMLGCVGEDVFGGLCIDALRAVGVDVQLIQRTREAATGMAAILVNPSSKRMVTSGGANACLEVERVPLEIFGPGVHLHVATPLFSIALPLLRRAKQAGATTSCDLDGESCPELSPLLDFCLMNQTDLTRWLGSVTVREAWERLGSSANLIVTQGARGATAVAAGAEVFASAFDVPVVDRTGGGDAFDAGFLFGLAQGGSLATCLRMGLFMAAGVVAGVGARPDTVDLESLGRFSRSS
jgi:ribokinase